MGVEAVLIAAILKGAMVFGFARSLDCRAAAAAMVRRSKIRVLAVVAIVLEIMLKLFVLCSIVIEQCCAIFDLLGEIMFCIGFAYRNVVSTCGKC